MLFSLPVFALFITSFYLGDGLNLNYSDLPLIWFSLIGEILLFLFNPVILLKSLLIDIDVLTALIGDYKRLLRLMRSLSSLMSLSFSLIIAEDSFIDFCNSCLSLYVSSSSYSYFLLSSFSLL